jgi:AraC-like DNA-binding protein
VSNVISLSPDEWNHCQPQLLKLRFGPPTDEGRCIEYSSMEQAAWRLERGTATLTTPSQTFVAKPGDWLFLSIGNRRQEFSEDALLVSVAFKVHWSSSLRPALDFRPGVLVPSAPELDALLTECRRRLEISRTFEWHYQATTCDIESALEMEAWFRRWLAATIRLLRGFLPELESERDVDPRLERARRYLMGQSEAEPNIDVSKASAAAGMSEGHLNRMFLKHYHMTMHGFHEHRRHLYAQQRLLDRETTIKTVAADLGFSDLSKFSRWFRRLEMVSPRTYRQRCSFVSESEFEAQEA